jgi:hypothetical protein
MIICSNRYEARGPTRELWLPDRNSKPEHGERLGSLKGKTGTRDRRERRHRSRVSARLRARRATIVFNGMGAPAEVEKERSAIKNDFGVKSV